MNEVQLTQKQTRCRSQLDSLLRLHGLMLPDDPETCQWFLAFIELQRENGSMALPALWDELKEL